METEEKNNLVKNITEIIDRHAEADEFSGVVCISKKGAVVLEYVTGAADKERNIPITLDTQFNIGSMDKMFTAVAIAQLAEKGKLSMQDKVVDFLPDAFKHHFSMTIHHILSHTEGFPSYFNDEFKENLLGLTSVTDYLKLFIHKPLLFEPGAQHQYSNSGYVVLGAIIENITGMSYYDYVAQHIFVPAGMLNTGSFDPRNPPPNLAKGFTNHRPFSHDLVPGSRRDTVSELPSKGSPAGGGYSTCGDLFRFAKALREFTFLGGDMTNFILSPKVKIETKNGETLYYGYGFQLLDYGKSRKRFGHAGSYTGANSRLDVYPWLDYTVVVLSNYDEPAAFTVANEISHLIRS